MSIKKNQGFTLIELMIVVAIVAIIAAIAYPSYQQYVKRTKRIEVQSYLMELSHKVASFKLVNRSYEGLTLSAIGSAVFPVSGTSNYNITIETLQNSTGRTNQIFFVAIPIASGSQKGDGVISLSTAGEQCWFKNNDTAKVKASKDADGNDVSATICTNKWTDK